MSAELLTRPDVGTRPSDEPARPDPPRRALRLVGECSFVAAVTTGIALWLYRAWELDLRVPMLEQGDARQIQMMLKGLEDSGWWLQNSWLNAPFGQVMHDFPHGGENWQFLLLKILNGFTGDPAVTFNLYYLASFPIVAVVTFLVCRHLRFTFWVSLLVGGLFAFLPFHTWHAAEHLFRTTYLNIPLGLLLVLWGLSPWDRFQRNQLPPVGWGGWQPRWGRLAAAASICVLLGMWETMTAAFFMALLAVTGIVAALRYREWQRLLVHFGMVVLIVVTFLIGNLPSLMYTSQEGGNDDAADRTVSESQELGLLMSRMLLPSFDGRTLHRVDWMSDLGSETLKAPLKSEGGQAIGVLGAIGFFAAVYRVVSRTMSRRVERADERSVMWDQLSLLTLVAVLFAVPSGFSWFTGISGFEQVRTWNRMVLVIALCSFLIVAIGLDRIASRRQLQVWGGLLAVVLLTLGLLDTTSSQAGPYKELRRGYDRDAAFVRQVEAVMPPGAMIFQVPIVRFPEDPGSHRYSPLRGYLHSTDLRWSFGGVRGRPDADWQVRLRRVPLHLVADRVAAIGFTGLWLDAVFAERPGELIRGAEGIFGPATVIDRNRLLAFWDLRPWHERRLAGRPPEEVAELARRTLGRASEPDAPGYPLQGVLLGLAVAISAVAVLVVTRRPRVAPVEPPPVVAEEWPPPWLEPVEPEPRPEPEPVFVAAPAAPRRRARPLTKADAQRVAKRKARPRKAVKKAKKATPSRTSAGGQDARRPARTAVGGPASGAPASSRHGSGGPRKARSEPESIVVWKKPRGEVCPKSHPIKAKLGSGIFHLPGMSAYARTGPDRCYQSEASAESDGLRKAKR